MQESMKKIDIISTQKQGYVGLFQHTPKSSNNIDFTGFFLAKVSL
jgi:hypothetical protein